jgi:hypothetical protein
MNFNPKNIICIHLTRFNSAQEFEKMLRDNGISNYVESKVLMDLKRDGFLKIWLDSSKYETIAWTKSPNKKEVCFSQNYSSFLKDMKSLSFIHVEQSTSNYNIDNILDKISVYGINSLTVSEKQFLDNSSKL